MGKIVIADRVRSLRASTSLAGLLLAGVVAVAPAQTARAGTVWVGGTPGFENDYDTASNWAPADVPNGLGETAEFNNGTIRTTVSKTGATSIDAFQFDAGAPSYTINLDPGGFGFELHGAGIVNNSGVMQTINLLSPGLVLLNNASLGDANVVVNLTGTGQLNFLDASTGGLATVNIGGNFGVLIDGAGHALTLGALSGTDGRVQFSGANQSLTVGGNNLSTTFGGTFTEAGGTGSLTKVGTGTLTLTNPGNAYSGGTTISGGTLTVGAASALGTGSVSLGNAHLRAAVDFAVPGSAFIFQSGSVSRVSAAAGTTLTIASTSLSFSGPSDIHFGAPGDTGTVALGSWIDANLGNTYAIDAGTLKLVGDFVVPLLNSPGLTVASGAKLDMNGTQAGTKVLSGGGTITNGAAGTTSNFRLFGSGADSLFSGRLEDGAGTVSLSKDLGSALTLSGTNTYSGSTQITGGTLRGGATNAFSAASAVNVAATLDLGGFNQTIGSLSGPGRVTNSGASLAVLSTNGDNRSTTFSGVIDNGAGGLALAKAGTGTLTLSGINTYSGGTMIGDGVLIAGGASALGSSAVSFTGNSTLRIGFDGTLANIINGTSGVSPTIGIGTHVVRLDGALSYLGGSGTTMHFGEAGDTGTLILAPSIASLDRYGAWSLDSGTLQLGSPASGSLGGLSAADLAAGTTLDLNGYVLQLVNPTGSGTVLNNGSSGVMLGLSGTSTFAGAIENGTQPISVTKFGTGTTTLSGVSTYTGVTNILDGTLALSGDGSIKDSSSINLSSLSALDISQTTAGTSVKSLSGGSSSSVKLGSKTLTIDTAGNTSYAGVISGSGGVTKTGGAVLDLFGANTYFGSTNVAGGLMRLVTGTTLLNSSAINISNGATFSTNTTNNLSSAVAVDLTGAGSRFATSTDQQIGSLAGAAGTSVWLDPGVVLTTGASNTNTIFSGNLGYNGEGSLTKVGTGSFTLNGTNGYTGTTTIKDGSLIVNGSIVASSLTTVEAGATLGGSGTVGNTVVDGTLSAGNSPGTLTVDGDLTLGGGSKTVFELNTPGLVGGTGIAGNDLVDVHDNLTLGGALDASVAAAGYYRLFNYGGTLSGAFGSGTLTGIGGFAPLSQNNPDIRTDIDHQVNLSVLAAGQTMQFWDGGSAAANNTVDGGTGTWQNFATNWTNDTGSANGGWGGSVGVFAGSAGTVTVDGTQGFDTLQFSTDGYVVTGGTLALNPASGTAGTFNIDPGVSTTIASTIANGTGNELSKVRGGTLVLSGTNTYDGGTQILGGTLSVSSDANLGAASGALTFDGGTLQVTGTTFNSTARNIIWGANGGGFDITDSGHIFSVSQSLSGPGGLTKTGAGTLALSSINSYSGGTTVSQGSLFAAATGALGTGPVTVDAAGGTFTALTFGLSANAGTSAINLANADSYLIFADSASAGSATIANSGQVNFNDSSSAGSAVITNGANAIALFQGSSTAGSATLVNDAGSNTAFDQTSRAGNATIVNDGGVDFHHDSTADNATITNNGILTFHQNATAGSATITSQGRLELFNDSSAGNATIAMKAGSSTLFADNSSGGNARFIADAGATFDISGLASAGTATGSIEGAGSYLLGSKNLTVGGNNSSTTVSGIIGDGGIGLGTGGSLTKTGTGTLTLSGINTYTGTTSVNGGTLSVNGSIAASALTTVNAGGTLGGTGTLGATTVASGGTLAPGNSIGTLNVAGNVAFAAGSTYEVEVDAAGQSDKTVVTGTATIDGGTVRVLAGSGNYAPQTGYTILTVAGGRTGTFADATSNLAFLTPVLGYDANNVYLAMQRNDVTFAGIGGTPNQQATGAGAESLGFGSPVYAALTGLSADQARAAFDALSGEMHASAKTALIESSHFLRDTANERIRAAFDGVGASAMPVLAYGETSNGATAAIGHALASAGTERVSAWGSVFGSWGSSDGDGNAAGLDRSTGGFLTGIDGLVAENVRLGILTGYSHDSFHADDRASSGSSNNYHFGLYGGTQMGALGLRAGAAYTWHDVRTTRSVAFPGFADNLSADYDGGTFQAFGELGYRIDTAAASFEPFANLAYVNLHTDSFTEKGGAGALASPSQDTDATFTTLGIRASTAFDLGGMKATARGMVGWRHAFGDTTPLATQAFASGNTFTIAGVPIARDAAVLEAGLDFTVSESATLGISYTGQFSSHARDNGAKANFRVKF